MSHRQLAGGVVWLELHDERLALRLGHELYSAADDFDRLLTTLKLHARMPDQTSQARVSKELISPLAGLSAGAARRAFP